MAPPPQEAAHLGHACANFPIARLVCIDATDANDTGTHHDAIATAVPITSFVGQTRRAGAAPRSERSPVATQRVDSARCATPIVWPPAPPRC